MTDPTNPAETIRQAEELAWWFEERGEARHASPIRAVCALAEPKVKVIEELRKLAKDRRREAMASLINPGPELRAQAVAFDHAADLLTQAMGEPPAGEGGNPENGDRLRYERLGIVPVSHPPEGFTPSPRDDPQAQEVLAKAAALLTNGEHNEPRRVGSGMDKEDQRS